MPPGETMVAVWITSLLGLSAVAWVNSSGVPKAQKAPPGLSIRGLDYLIFLWIFLVIFLLVQTGMQFALSPETDSAGESEQLAFSSSQEWHLVLSSLSLQIPMLGAMLFAFSFKQLPFHHAEPSNSNKGVGQEVLFGFRTFLMCLPIIWLVAAVWKVPKLRIVNSRIFSSVWWH